MLQKMSLPVMVGLVLSLVILSRTSLVEARWGQSNEAGHGFGTDNFLLLCPDGGRFGFYAPNSKRVGKYNITFTDTKGNNLASKSFDLLEERLRIPGRWKEQPITHYNYVTVSWHLPPGTEVWYWLEQEDSSFRYPHSGTAPGTVHECKERDRFNRSGPELGSNWRGQNSLNDYKIKDDKAVKVLAGGPIYWHKPFGEELEVQVRLVRIDKDGRHRLLLQVQPDGNGNPDLNHGAIAVFYNATAKRIGVEKYKPGTGWRTLRTFDQPLADGDLFAARLIQNDLEAPFSETVFVFVNDQLVGAHEIKDQFFVGKGGSIGLWFKPGSDKSVSTIFDDFRGY